MVLMKKREQYIPYSTFFSRLHFQVYFIVDEMTTREEELPGDESDFGEALSACELDFANLGCAVL
jgi:hypothetical protein